MMKNFCGRLHNAVQGVLPKHIHGKITLLAPANRHIATWQGGSVLAALDTFENYWVTKKAFSDGEGHQVLTRDNCM